ncbi:hypothetical protein ACFQE1_06665 [Halobium palmae]|uniref:Uncharacterized protein n=1 Tax=Halobium palmae TaxID=1776492 RepID=A0ABD5RXK5_9EURY
MNQYTGQAIDAGRSGRGYPPRGRRREATDLATTETGDRSAAGESTR